MTVRYKQTAIGVLWAMLQPLLLAAVFRVFLGGWQTCPSGDTPYGLFAVTGMTMWLFFATSIARCSESTIANAQLISKVYFPRIVIPVAAIMPAVVDFLAAFVVLLGVLAVFGVFPTVKILLVPLVFAVAFAVALGVGFWLSATGRPLPRREQHCELHRSCCSSSPRSSIRSAPSRTPTSPSTRSIRWWACSRRSAGRCCRTRALRACSLLIPTVTGLVLLVTGLLYFHRVEHRFADVI